MDNEQDIFNLPADADQRRPKTTANYDDDAILSLSWFEHIQQRPGMYIGKLGDGTNSDDGIYVLLKEVIDNSIDEFMMGYGHQIIVNVDEHTATVRDYGRGIPLGSVIDVASKMNTGGKFKEGAFTQTVGLNGVGIKAVNALSTNSKSHRTATASASVRVSRSASL